MLLASVLFGVSLFLVAVEAPAAPADRSHFNAAACPTPTIGAFRQPELGPTITCGYLTVPRNHARPDGPTIKIAVAIAKAVSPKPEPDPLVWLVGGPGGSGLLIANAAVSLGLNANREIIFVDQRGTLNSNPLLSCPEIDTYMAASIGLAPGAPRPGTADVAAVNACHARLVAEGNELADFDTAQNAADIADLRTALGIKEWNLYGVSYGSYLALSILRDHPTGIRSVVLDGVVPTNANLINDSWPNAAREYQAIIDACDAQPPCKAAYPHLRTEFIKTINRLTRHPLTVTVPAPTGSATTKVVFDGYQLANLVVALSVDKSGADLAEVPAMIDALAHGNGTLAATALRNHAATPPGIVGYGLQWGFFCREEVAFTSPAKMLSAAKRALPGFPTATLRLMPQLPRVFEDCRVWDVGRASPHVHAIVTSEIPVLLMSGTFDGVTPPIEASIAVSGLSDAHLVEFPGLGHQTLASACAQQVMLRFLDAPGPHSNTTCVSSIVIPPFKTP